MNKKIIGGWLLIGILAGGAFFTGDQLRGLHKFVPFQSKEALPQASALLKLTPELSPVTKVSTYSGTGENRELVNSVFNLLKRYYVEPITPEKETKMSQGAVEGMLASLGDADSRFVDPSERKLLDDAKIGKFHGIGAILALKDGRLNKLDTTNIVVVAPMPGSPAEEAGLKPGDSITYINGKWIISYDPFAEAGMKELETMVRNKKIDELQYQKTFDAANKKLKDGINISDTLDILTSKTSGNIDIRVKRPGKSKLLDFKLPCKVTIVKPVTTRTLKNNIAYIRISQFNSLSSQEFAKALNQAKSSRAKGLILDLRSNPGGLMDNAKDIVGKLTGGGILATIREKNGQRIIRTPKSEKPNLPMVVLIDAGTSSVAELVAGDLKDNGAILVGTTTFGDGLTQTPLLLSDGSVAILTTGKMLTSKGYDFNQKGIIPDKKVLQASGDSDKQLDEAQNLLLSKLGKG